LLKEVVNPLWRDSRRSETVVETVYMKDLSDRELEIALRKALGIRAFLTGVGKVGKMQVVHAGSVRLEFIDDDASDQRAVTFTQVPDVFALEIERKGGRYFVIPPDGDAFQRLEERFRGFLVRHEGEVLKYSYQNLVRIPEVELAMRPLSEILIHIHEYGEFAPRASRSRHQRSRLNRIMRYAQLLTDLGFIKRRGAAFVAGTSLPHGIAPETPPEEVNVTYLGAVLRASHKFLTEALHLTMIKPFLRIENAYYWPAHRLGTKLQIQRLRFRRVYSGYYGRAAPKFETHLQSLIRKEALTSKNGKVTGVDQVLEPLLRTDFDSWISSESSMISPP
jgi:hypothetical protein